jgi:hypothetical protein
MVLMRYRVELSTMRVRGPIHRGSKINAQGQWMRFSVLRITRMSVR